MVMGHFPKEMLDMQLNFAICTYKKVRTFLQVWPKWLSTVLITAHFIIYHCTFWVYHCTNWLSLHTKIRYVPSSNKKHWLSEQWNQLAFHNISFTHESAKQYSKAVFSLKSFTVSWSLVLFVDVTPAFSWMGDKFWFFINPANST